MRLDNGIRIDQPPRRAGQRKPEPGCGRRVVWGVGRGAGKVWSMDEAFVLGDWEEFTSGDIRAGK